MHVDTMQYFLRDCNFDRPACELTVLMRTTVREGFETAAKGSSKSDDDGDGEELRISSAMQALHAEIVFLSLCSHYTQAFLSNICS